MASSGPSLTTIKSASGATGSVNSAYAGNFQNFINQLEATGYSVRSIGGYNYRTIAGTNTLSNHAFGNAIDINPFDNVPGFGGRSAANNYPSNINDLASANGLTWGGNWNNPDSMHFEVRNGSAPVALDVSAPSYLPDYDPSISKTGAYNNYADQSFTPQDDGGGGMQFGMGPIGGGSWGDSKASEGKAPEVNTAAAPGAGDNPLEVTVQKGAQGLAKDVPTAIVTAGNQQATATANAAKAESESTLKATQAQTQSDQKLQASSQSWASNWAVRIFLFIIGAIFIAGGLFLFGGQTIFQSKTAGE